MSLGLLILTLVVAIIVERVWPAHEQLRVPRWYSRLTFLYLFQLAITLISSFTWTRWLKAWSLLDLARWCGTDTVGTIIQSVVAYVLASLIFYWWHRLRHESQLLWNVLHQVHHSPQRLEALTAFYAHPVEQFATSVINAAILYTLFGCSTEAAALFTLYLGVAECFQHANIRTPRWIGYFIQRPEAHRIHHKRGYHTKNFVQLSLWDMLFGTFENPPVGPERTGFHSWREDRFEDMLVFRDVNGDADARSPIRFLPAVLGCAEQQPDSAQAQPLSAQANGL